ncbi:MAG: hypothetical protein CL919_00170 [Deltaproteobacteria bacterium]|nr:hypothetical protein [Deltaproteobacteria bacterium]
MRARSLGLQERGVLERVGDGWATLGGFAQDTDNGGEGEALSVPALRGAGSTASAAVGARRLAISTMPM